MSFSLIKEKGCVLMKFLLCVLHICLINLVFTVKRHHVNYDVEKLKNSGNDCEPVSEPRNFSCVKKAELSTESPVQKVYESDEDDEDDEDDEFEDERCGKLDVKPDRSHLSKTKDNEDPEDEFTMEGELKASKAKRTKMESYSEVDDDDQGSGDEVIDEDDQDVLFYNDLAEEDSEESDLENSDYIKKDKVVNLEGEDDDGEEYYGNLNEDDYDDYYNSLTKDNNYAENRKVATVNTDNHVSKSTHFIRSKTKNKLKNRTEEKYKRKPQNITLIMSGKVKNLRRGNEPAVAENVITSNLKSLVNEITNIVSSVVNSGPKSSRHRNKKHENDRDDNHVTAKHERSDKEQPNGRRGSSRKLKSKRSKWSEWSLWSACSVTCGLGRSVRWRNCLHSDCDTAQKEFEQVPCQLPDCPPVKLFGIFG